jgi:Predicted membrane protein
MGDGLNMAPNHHAGPKADGAQRLLWLDVAKGLSILLVVLHHAQLAAASVDHGWHVFAQVSSLFKPVRMPLFFLVAGMVAARSMEMPLSSLLRGRIANLLYLYGLWTAISWIYYRHVDPTDGDYLLGRHYSQLATMWLIPLSGQWFLWLLAIFHIFARVVAPMRSVTALLLICAMTQYWAETLDHLPHYSWRNALLYAPFFVAGQWYGRQIANWLPGRARMVFLTGVLCYGSLIVLFGPEAILSAMASNIPGSRLALSAAGLGVGLSVSVMISRSAIFRGPLSHFGRNSLTIYLAHGILLSICAISLAALSLPPLSYLWMTPLLILLAIPASLGLSVALGSFGKFWLYSSDGIRKLVDNGLSGIMGMARLSRR